MPIMILLIMKYLAAEILDFHMVPCESRARDLGEVFRLDAKAEWFASEGERGRSGRGVVCGVAET